MSDQNAKNAEIVELTKQIIDLKLEKKNFNQAQNEMIKDTEAQIKKLCKE